jgi:transposase
MSEDTLFPMCDAPAPTGGPDNMRAPARVHVPERNQVEMIMAALDSLLAEDHQARVVWAFVERQDLSELYGRIRATEDRPGRTPIDPQLLMALWLNATLDGVGSARELARRCEDDVAYRWLCGGVSVNYHTLSDFRVDHAEFLDALLTRNVAALMCEGLVSLTRVAQDGMRVRASAGASSYRRQPTLEQCLEEAKAQVEALRTEAQEESSSGTARVRAARERAARERQERLERALARSEEIRAARPEKTREKVRVSTTDPQVPIMKMGDGGFRPAANVQFATDTGSQIISGVDVTGRGTDRGEMPPMLDQHVDRYGAHPGEFLVDGGFVSKEDIDAVSASGTGSTVFAPVPKPKDEQRDRFEPLDDDSEAVAAWRRRMGTTKAQEIYKDRASTAECVNAIARNRGLRQFTVRGLKKIKAVVLWYVLAHNLMRAHHLRLAKA